MKRKPNRVTTIIILLIMVGSVMIFDARAGNAMTDLKELRPGIVRILSVIGSDKARTGTGFVLNRHGIIVTSYPMASLGIKVLVDVGTDGQSQRPAVVLWTSREHDLSILSVAGIWEHPVTLAAMPPETGTPVQVVGFAKGLSQFQTQGRIPEPETFKGIIRGHSVFSIPGRSIQSPLILHDAHSPIGASGGPLLNTCGQVVGLQRSPQRLLLPNDAENIQDENAIAATPVATLIAILEKQNIAFTVAKASCSAQPGNNSPPSPDSSPSGPAKENPPSGSKTETEMHGIWIDLAIGLLIVAALLLILWLTLSRLKTQKKISTNKRKIIAATARGWYLTSTDPSGKSVVIKLSERELRNAPQGVILGREPGKYIKTISDGSISRQHARLTVSHELLFLEDLGSTNGTFVGGQRLQPFQPVPISLGDKCQLGKIFFILRSC
ncbi:MAG: FHA domain-containing protein [Magnetococcales bacterium]|nr:FHA domain-containing protein [Magnetococcales bacterium]